VFAFRFVNVSGQSREVRWAKYVSGKVSALKALMPKLNTTKCVPFDRISVSTLQQLSLNCAGSLPQRQPSRRTSALMT
jgi:hypothetical protein